MRGRGDRAVDGALPRPRPRQRPRELAAERRRFGYRRLHVLLRREGVAVNHKRGERLYRAEGLGIRVKRRRKRVSLPRAVPPAARRPQERWSLDFLADGAALPGPDDSR